MAIVLAHAYPNSKIRKVLWSWLLDIAAEFAFFTPQVFSSEILDALEWKLIWELNPQGCVWDWDFILRNGCELKLDLIF